MNWFVDVLKNKYATFTGRAHRTEYWMFVLFGIIFGIVATVIDAIITGGLLGVVYTLGIIVPSIAVAVRRLHDTNRSGWWLLLWLIPLAGLILIYFLVLDSEPGENEYGPNPKGIPAAAPAAA